MSVHNAVAFIEKAASDKLIRDTIAAAKTGRKPEESAAAVAALGKSLGYDFTPAEARGLRAQTRKAMIAEGTLKDELDDLDLQAVTGGANPIRDYIKATGGSDEVADIFSGW